MGTEMSDNVWLTEAEVGTRFCSTRQWVEDGVTPEQIIDAAYRYATHVETFSEKYMKTQTIGWQKKAGKNPADQTRTEFSAYEIQKANVN